MRTKPPAPILSDDLAWIDAVLARALERRGYFGRNHRLHAVLRDVYLSGVNDAAERAQDTASGVDDEPQNPTAAERAAYRALSDFASTLQAQVDRLRAEAGLPERDGKSVQAAIRDVLRGGA